jgi:hypothetical protein
MMFNHTVHNTTVTPVTRVIERAISPDTAVGAIRAYEAAAWAMLTHDFTLEHGDLRVRVGVFRDPVRRQTRLVLTARMGGEMHDYSEWMEWSHPADIEARVRVAVHRLVSAYLEGLVLSFVCAAGDGMAPAILDTRESAVAAPTGRVR